MLKFSGWSCLISGRMFVRGAGRARPNRFLLWRSAVVVGARPHETERKTTAACSNEATYQAGAPLIVGGPAASPVLQPTRRQAPRRPHPPPFSSTKGGGRARGEPTLRQACPRPRSRAQYAFKDSMIHGILQFTLRIAFRCVLHRCGSQDIRC